MASVRAGFHSNHAGARSKYIEKQDQLIKQADMNPVDWNENLHLHQPFADKIVHI